MRCKVTHESWSSRTAFLDWGCDQNESRMKTNSRRRQEEEAVVIQVACNSLYSEQEFLVWKEDRHASIECLLHWRQRNLRKGLHSFSRCYKNKKQSRHFKEVPLISFLLYSCCSWLSFAWDQSWPTVKTKESSHLFVFFGLNCSFGLCIEFKFSTSCERTWVVSSDAHCRSFVNQITFCCHV